jgi:flagellar hook-basal body complex protein FliE
MLTAINSLSAASTAWPANTADFGASISAGAEQVAAPAPFAGLLTDAIGQVDQLQQQASSAVTGLMTGAGVDVHQAMIATEKADMAFEMALAVRNKAVQAYQQVIGMQF